MSVELVEQSWPTPEEEKRALEMREVGRTWATVEEEELTMRRYDRLQTLLEIVDKEVEAGVYRFGESERIALCCHNSRKAVHRAPRGAKTDAGNRYWLRAFLREVVEPLGGRLAIVEASRRPRLYRRLQRAAKLVGQIETVLAPCLPTALDPRRNA